MLLTSKRVGQKGGKAANDRNVCFQGLSQNEVDTIIEGYWCEDICILSLLC
jgi:hypothetical protein